VIPRSGDRVFVPRRPGRPDRASQRGPHQERDSRLSTLARYVEALGGRLDVRAIFDDDIKLTA
jgi:hypothetical protein